jgi:hypothetical protein
MQIPREYFNQKKYEAAMEEYIRGLYGIPLDPKTGKSKSPPQKKKGKKKTRKK